LVGTLALVGCGSSADTNDGGSGDSGSGKDAGHDVANGKDSGQPETAPPGYPAFPVDYPQVLKNQGAVLEEPVLVTVSWPGDPNASTWEAFGDGIGASSYWAATTSEYGIGKVTSGAANHVRMTEPLPAMLSYYDIPKILVAALGGEVDGGLPDTGATDAGGANPSWPMPTLDAKGNVETIYSLFIPSSTVVPDPGTGTSLCSEGGLGYHDSVQLVKDGPWVPFSVTLGCTSQTLPQLEETAAHETVEAATDPYTESATLGYIHFDAQHLAWDLFSGFNDELADACQDWADSYFQETGSFPYWVQRSWSNKAALAGHDPCVPAPAGAYYGMTLFPSEEASVSINTASFGGAGVETSRGFEVTIGKPLTFHVGFFSDGPTAPWPVSVVLPPTLALFDASFNPLKNGAGTVKIDKTSGQNGDKATVTVTPTEKGEAGFQIVVITWDAPPESSGYLPHYLPVLLVDH
jgi:hypothetical protein